MDSIRGRFPQIPLKLQEGPLSEGISTSFLSLVSEMSRWWWHDVPETKIQAQLCYDCLDDPGEGTELAHLY